MHPTKEATEPKPLSDDQIIAAAREATKRQAELEAASVHASEAATKAAEVFRENATAAGVLAREKTAIEADRAKEAEKKHLEESRETVARAVAILEARELDTLQKAFNAPLATKEIAKVVDVRNKMQAALHALVAVVDQEAQARNAILPRLNELSKQAGLSTYQNLSRVTAEI